MKFNSNIRFRIDGHLIEKYHWEPEAYVSLVNQIKIKSNLDIAERRLPQDGRILITEPVAIDLRVSILPVLHFVPATSGKVTRHTQGELLPYVFFSSIRTALAKPVNACLVAL